MPFIPNGDVIIFIGHSDFRLMDFINECIQALMQQLAGEYSDWIIWVKTQPTRLRSSVIVFFGGNLFIDGMELHLASFWT